MLPDEARRQLSVAPTTTVADAASIGPIRVVVRQNLWYANFSYETVLFGIDGWVVFYLFLIVSSEWSVNRARRFFLTEWAE